LGCRSRPSTVACLENRADANVAALFGRGALAGFPVVGADRLAGDLGGLDFARALRMAIRFSLVSTTASCAATDTSPVREGRARGRYEPRSGLLGQDAYGHRGSITCSISKTVTLRWPQKSSEFGAILWLFSSCRDHELSLSLRGRVVSWPDGAATRRRHVCGHSGSLREQAVFHRHLAALPRLMRRDGRGYRRLKSEVDCAAISSWKRRKSSPRPLK
jgi:hypothetical protein